jgi:hypothetical protein
MSCEEEVQATYTAPFAICTGQFMSHGQHEGGARHYPWQNNIYPAAIWCACEQTV